MSRKRNNETGRFISGGLQSWQIFMEKHESVQEWLENRPLGTRAQYCRKLMSFCKTVGIAPEGFLELNRLAARDLVWNFVKPFIRESTSKAKNNLAALKSFYRSKDGETLPFDSRRGGKHYFNSKRRKKAAIEHVPSKTEMYRIIDVTNNIRDKSMLLMLFQSGIRVNALRHLRFGDVKSQLYPEPKIPLRLRITDKIDTKLQGYAIDFYDARLQGEAVEALKAYCEKYHREADENKPLFSTKLGNPMNETAVWSMFKKCVRRAGLDPSRIWVHTIRKAFKRVVRHAPVDDEDFKEAIMGHVLPNSRENYFSRYECEELDKEYMKIDFSRQIPESKFQRQNEQIIELQSEIKKQTKEIKALKGFLHEKEHVIWREKLKKEEQRLFEGWSEQEKKAFLELVRAKVEKAKETMVKEILEELAKK